MADAFQALIDDTPRRLLRTSLAQNMHDPKLPDARHVIYAPSCDLQACKDMPEARELPPASYFLGENAEHGLLYLPHPYLVPGGRFNEMYGWDTAFPVFAWAETHTDVMRQQVENQLYQIRAYGKVLNANRSYYLSRSQPPLIAAMVLAVFEVTKDAAWLAGAYEDLRAYHDYWTSGDRLAGDGRLSRYWDEGDTPGIEVMKGEPDHYPHAMKHFTAHPDTRFYKDGKLTPLYYRADRSMRASGLDPTGHWGYGGLDCIFHAPLCLNALLYRMEGDMADVARYLGNGGEAAWYQKQSARKAAMREVMFDSKTGLYHDYDFSQNRQNTDPFATFFHALWAGLYDDDFKTAMGAATLALRQLETPHGICTSTRTTGSQWDRPNGWPPLHYFAIYGLARAGLDKEARRVAEKFIALARHVYAGRDALFEKYNVEQGNADIRVVHGYAENVSEQGTFLWTAATLKLAADFLARGTS